MENPIRFENSLRNDADGEVKELFQAAEKRKEAEIRYHLLGELLKGKVIDITKSKQLFEAVNKEKMDFEEILKLHPEEVKEHIEYVKQRREEQNGRWYNPDSQAWWGEKGVIPPCCYFARPTKYWKDKNLVNSFLNTFPVFRIAEREL
jgi:hypothetical protein